MKIAASKSVLVWDFRWHRSNTLSGTHQLADLLHSQIGLTPRYRLTGGIRRGSRRSWLALRCRCQAGRLSCSNAAGAAVRRSKGHRGVPAETPSRWRDPGFGSPPRTRRPSRARAMGVPLFAATIPRSINSSMAQEMATTTSPRSPALILLHQLCRRSQVMSAS